MTELTSPPDAAARRTAARAFDRNLLVVAGAGSGKTTLLVERLLNLCLGRGVPLSRVAALTFTEKAAAEMRERLAGNLSDAVAVLGGGERSGLDVPADRSLEWILAPAPEGAGVSADLARRRALEALDALDGGVLSTLHAFCADLLRRNPRECRLDPGFAVDDGFQSLRLLDREWATFQAVELGPQAPRAALWRRVLAAVEPESVRGVAESLVRRGRSVADVGGQDVLALVAPRVQDVLDRCRRALALEGTDLFRHRLTACVRVLEVFAAEGAEAGRIALDAAGLDFLDGPPMRPAKKCEDPQLAAGAMRDALRLVKAVSTVDEALVADVLEAVAPLVERVREASDREGFVPFDRLLVAARDLLRDVPLARARERARLDAILLDEFQDTDPLQYEISFLLAGRGDAVAGPSNPWRMDLTPGRLFLVGDPKQSIYRFRGADVGALTRAVDRLVECGGEVLTLTANFRSRSEVLGPINQLCAAVMVEAPPYQPRYEAIEAARHDALAGEPRVEVWTVRHEGTGAAANRLAEARAIAREVAEWRRAGIVGGFGEVAVLLRAMTDVALYQRGLAESGVPFVTQGGIGFVERDEIVQALTLLRCLVRPNDPAALLAVLQSPSCGADDVELARFAAMVRAHPGLDWTFRCARALPADAGATIPAVRRTLLGLEALARRVARLPADEALRIVLGETAAPAVRDPVTGEPGGRPADGAAWSPMTAELNAAGHGGAQRLANLDKLVARAADLARREALPLAGVVDELEREHRRGAPQGESPLADEAVDAVRIMTIHQSKGLEFDVVVLPDLARPERGGREGGVRAEVVDGLLSIVLRDGRRNLASLVTEEQARRHDAAEQCRLLYVAMTRARERLVLVNGNLRPRADAWPGQAIAEHWGYSAASGGGALLGGAVVHRVMDDAPSPASVQAADPLEDVVAALAAQDAAAASMAPARRGRPRSATGSREDLERSRDVEEYSPVAQAVGEGDDEAKATVLESTDPVDARTTGIAVHLALEQWDFRDGAHLAALGRRAARLAADETGADLAAVERRVEALLAGLARPAALGPLRDATILARELPFLMERDGVPWQGFIDLVVEIEGRTWVVDWKTDREVAPERHRDQLALYAEAVRRWRNLPAAPGTALVYVTQGLWEAVTQPG